MRFVRVMNVYKVRMADRSLRVCQGYLALGVWTVSSGRARLQAFSSGRDGVRWRRSKSGSRADVTGRVGPLTCFRAVVSSWRQFGYRLDAAVPVAWPGERHAL